MPLHSNYVDQEHVYFSLIYNRYNVW